MTSLDMISETSKNNNKIVACKLVDAEFQKYKAEVIGSIKNKILQKVELADGYEFKFGGSDELLQELAQFIKAERACCNFFTFKLTIEDASSPITLRISGPQGAKEFIDKEMGL